MKTNRSRKLIKNRTDAAAAAVFFTLAALLIATAHLSWVHSDEYFYHAITQRLLNGDRLMYDEWSFVQFASLFEIIPFALFTKLTGGTDGIILFLRYIYIAVNLALFCFLYRKMRSAGVVGLLAAALFCADTFCGTLILSYYNISTYSVVIICMLLITAKEPPKKGILLLCGVLLSAAVLCEPVAAAVYLLWSGIVLILHLRSRKKTAGAPAPVMLSGRTWLWVSLSVAVCAAAVSTYLLISVGLSGIIDTLSHMLSVNPYEILSGGTGRLTRKWNYLTAKFGFINVLLMAAAPVAAAVLSIRRKRGADTKKGSAAVFLYTSAVFIWIIVYSLAAADLANDTETYFRSWMFPVFCLTLSFLLLDDRRDPRDLFFFAAAVVFSLPMDLTSNFTLLSFGRLLYIPGVFLTVRLIRRLFPDVCESVSAAIKNRRRKKRTERGTASGNTEAKKTRPRRLSVLAAILICAVLLCQAGSIFGQMEYYPLLTITEHITLARAPFGPDKGIWENENIWGYYSYIIEDIKQIRYRCKGSFYVASRVPICYLCADLPVGTYFPLYQKEDLDRIVLEYWNARPEKRPQFIYIPRYDNEELNTSMEENLERIRRLCDCTWEQSEVGITVNVHKWYDLPSGVKS